MRRLLAVVPLAVVALAGLPAAPAQASCAMRDARTILGVDAAFVGTFVERRGPHLVFSVEQVVKGDLGPEVLVLAPAEPGTSVDLRPVPGRRVGLGLRIAPAGWYTNACNEMDPGALLATGGRPCDRPAVASVRRLTAARAGRPVRVSVRMRGAADAASVTDDDVPSPHATRTTWAAGDDGAVLRHRFPAGRRRVVTARVETVPFGGCGAESLRSEPRRLSFRVSRA